MENKQYKLIGSIVYKAVEQALEKYNLNQR